MTRRRFLATTASAGLLVGTRLQAQEKRWRVGVVGHTGRGDYGHGMHTMWLGLPQAEIVGVADADPGGLEKARQKLNGAPGFTSYREMLERVRPEIVAICPRHVEQHRDMALAAVTAGAKGLYVEKPFCRTPAEADEILDACAKSGTKVALAHRNRFHPALPVTKRLIDDGLIGQALEVRGRGKEDQRGGALDLWVLGSHVVNLACYFAGVPRSCSAALYTGNRLARPADVVAGAEGVGPIAGDRLHARYEMESAIPFYFDSIRGAGVRAAGFGLQIIGNKGIIDLRIDEEPLVHYLAGNPFHPKGGAKSWVPITSEGVGKPESISELTAEVAEHRRAARDLFEAITQDRQPLCSGEDGRLTVEMIHAAFASHVSSGRTVNLPLSDRVHAFDAWTRA
jgi:predicted dehydrogenase